MTAVALASCVLSVSVTVSCAPSTIATAPAPSVNATGPKSMPAGAPFRSTTGATFVTVRVAVAPPVPATLLMV